jgi:hypothetical protein
MCFFWEKSCRKMYTIFSAGATSTEEKWRHDVFWSHRLDGDFCHQGRDREIGKKLTTHWRSWTHYTMDFFSWFCTISRLKNISSFDKVFMVVGTEFSLTDGAQYCTYTEHTLNTGNICNHDTSSICTFAANRRDNHALDVRKKVYVNVYYACRPIQW